VVLGTILAILGGGCGGAATLGPAALQKQAEAVQSSAAEGALLAQDAAAGKITSIYTREHASDLRKAASRDAASLKTAKTNPALESNLRRLTVLADRTAADLDRLGGASRDEQRRLGSELEEAAKESEKIGEGLK
jgi:hypothetical protein